MKEQEFETNIKKALEQMSEENIQMKDALKTRVLSEVKSERRKVGPIRKIGLAGVVASLVLVVGIMSATPMGRNITKNMINRNQEMRLKMEDIDIIMIYPTEDMKETKEIVETVQVPKKETEELGFKQRIVIRKIKDAHNIEIRTLGMQNDYLIIDISEQSANEVFGQSKEMSHLYEIILIQTIFKNMPEYEKIKIAVNGQLEQFSDTYDFRETIDRNTEQLINNINDEIKVELTMYYPYGSGTVVQTTKKKIIVSVKNDGSVIQNEVRTEDKIKALIKAFNTELGIKLNSIVIDKSNTIIVDIDKACFSSTFSKSETYKQIYDSILQRTILENLPYGKMKVTVNGIANYTENNLDFRAVAETQPEGVIRNTVENSDEETETIVMLYQYGDGIATTKRNLEYQVIYQYAEGHDGSDDSLRKAHSIQRAFKDAHSIQVINISCIPAESIMTVNIDKDTARNIFDKDKTSAELYTLILTGVIFENCPSINKVKITVDSEGNKIGNYYDFNKIFTR